MNDLARTEDHAAARHKRITGSRVGTLLTGGLPGAGWDTLSDLLHNPEPEPFFSLENTPNMPVPMRRGLEFEPVVRGNFFLRHGEYEVEQPMFCKPGEKDFYDQESGVWTFTGDEPDQDIWEWIGVSPDGILVIYNGAGPAISELSGLEIKVPSVEKFLEWKEAGIVPLEHLPQCALSMLVTGAESWWFCAEVPELPEDERVFEIKIERDELYLDHMRLRIRQFLKGHLEHEVFSKPAIEQEIIPASVFPVINFDITDQAIAVLVERYSGMEAPTTTAQYAVVKAANLDMVKRRTSVVKTYKKATELARDYINGANAEHKRLLGLMADTESYLRSLRTTWEDEQQRLKDEAIAKEEARVATIRELIDWLNVGAMEGLRGLTSEQISTQIVTFQDTKITDEIYQEFFIEAENAMTAMMLKAVAYREEIFGQEQEAARVAKEQKDLRERNAQLERENQERQEREAELNRKRQEAEAAEQKERARVEAINLRVIMISSSTLEALEGNPEEAKTILFKLNRLTETPGVFEEKWDQVEPLLTKTIKAVTNIVASKQREADALKAEASDPEPVEVVKPVVESPPSNEEEKPEVSRFPDDPMFEAISAIQHDAIWSHWQRYVHSLLSKTRAIPMTNWRKWEQQINTPYTELSESEKDSDREQTLKFWDLIVEKLA